MSDDVIDADEGIRLKVHGALYKCATPVRKTTRKGTTTKLCGGQLFELNAQQPTDEKALYRCLRCDMSRYLDRDSVVEHLPPRNDWRTPGGTKMEPIENGLWTTLHTEYNFNLDAAADAANTKCPDYFDGLTPERDGLLAEWDLSYINNSDGMLVENFMPARAWWNCPYIPKGTVKRWLLRALEQAKRNVFSVGLIPMSSSVAWFNELVIPYCEWHTFRGRIAFEDPSASADEKRMSPKQDNLLVVIDPRSPLVGHCSHRDSDTGARLWTRPDAAARLARLAPHIPASAK